MAGLIFRLLYVIFLIGTPPPPPAAGFSHEASAALLVEEKTVTVGDLLTLTLEVRHPTGTQASLPQIKDVWQGTPVLEVRSQSRPETADNNDGTLTTRTTIQTVWFAPGEHKTPPVSVTIAAASGEIRSVQASGAVVNVTSVLTPADTALRDLKPQAELPGPPAWLWALGALFGLLALAGALWGFWLRRQKRKAGLDETTHPRQPPLEEAFQELARIETLRLLEAAQYKHYYTLVSDCLRTYLEARFGVPALECTSAEIRRGLAQKGRLQPEVNAFMDLFSESDLVKFAKFVPEPEAARNYLTRAHALVERTKPDEPAL